jgi:7-cyano-7-deazaguanine synthase
MDGTLNMTTGILLSGGMDSAALAAWQRPAVAFTIDYGQLPAIGEIRAATQIAHALGLQHEVLRVDCHQLGSGQLAGQLASNIAPVPEWWPYRNQLLLTLAAMRAIALGVDELLCGAVASDGAHADGRPEFFAAIDALTALQEGNLRVRVPAIYMTAAELVRISGIDMSILAWAHSCHTAAFACGVCRGCTKHQEVMVELGYAPY